MMSKSWKIPIIVISFSIATTLNVIYSLSIIPTILFSFLITVILFETSLFACSDFSLQSVVFIAIYICVELFPFCISNLSREPNVECNKYDENSLKKMGKQVRHIYIATHRLVAQSRQCWCCGSKSLWQRTSACNCTFGVLLLLLLLLPPQHRLNSSVSSKKDSPTLLMALSVTLSRQTKATPTPTGRQTIIIEAANQRTNQTTKQPNNHCNQLASHQRATV